MAHRKLQQEIDRVFKKINEGLEIFNTYYERHENCTNNPSQKDKLESDLKREVKKLQRLREQIKSWQSSAEVKDKDSLLEYRRSVEVAMEKYKAVEKASKEKAYSNNSLKRSEVLDPEEQERRDVSDYLSEKIDELERQFDQVQVEMDKLIAGGKKRKSGTSGSEDKKAELKQLQGRYRWHQQQMELALRLLANEELDPQAVRDIQDDINYFIDSNQEPDFVEDETIYESLNLDANEAIAHEVAASFAAQTAEDNDEELKDSSKLSKKEQRKLEREAKRAAKMAAKAPVVDSTVSTPVNSAVSSSLDSDAMDTSQITSLSTYSTADNDILPTPNASPSPSPTPTTSSSIPSTANTTATHCQPSKPQTPLLSKTQPQTSHISPEQQGHTNIHQTFNAVTTNTLKPATVPAKPVGELKWAVAAAQALDKEKKERAATAAAATVTMTTTSVTSTSAIRSRSHTTSNNTSVGNSTANGTSKAAHNEYVVRHGMNVSEANHHPKDGSELPKSGKSSYASKLPTQVNAPGKSELPYLDLIMDDYESESTDDELPDEPIPFQLDVEEYERRGHISAKLTQELCQNFELLRLPSGIQDIIIGSLLTENNLQPPDGKFGGLRSFTDICHVNRLIELPRGVNPPQPLDAIRCLEQWDVIRVNTITDEDYNSNTEDIKNAIYEKFRVLETFTLFYNYYYACTPLEHDIAGTILEEREWRISKDGVTWFLREGQPKFTNELCEVADFKIFKLDDWTAITKLNFTLDFSILKNVPKNLTRNSAAVHSDLRRESISHGQALLQQLNQGNAMKVEPSH